MRASGTLQCRYGYTTEDLAAKLGDKLEAFYEWNAGSTVRICEGRVYCEEAHGVVVYRIDVENFLAGLPVNPD